MIHKHKYGIDGAAKERETLRVLLAGAGGTTIGFIVGMLVMFATMQQAHASDENGDVFCLAQNIYFESGNQPTVGKIAVSHVVLNRVESDLYPDTICDVVYDSKTRINWKGNEVPIRNQCQFSWYCDGKSDKPKDIKAWDNAMLMAFGVYNGRVVDLVDGATHYHATYVMPEWAETKTETVRIADHIFYRWDY